MNNDTAATLLTVAVIMAIFFMLIWALFGFFLIYAVMKARRRIRRIEWFVNRTPTFTGLDILQPREKLTKNEVAQIKAYIRSHKEREARDRDTIDKATEFQHDF